MTKEEAIKVLDDEIESTEALIQETEYVSLKVELAGAKRAFRMAKMLIGQIETGEDEDGQ